MSRPSEQELLRLRLAAGEIVTTLEAEGYTVHQATNHHEAFRSGRGPTSSLERALVKHGAVRGAYLAGMHADNVVGGLELVSFDGLVERRYRIKAATFRSGRPHLLCGEKSTLLSTTQEPDSFTTVERWVLCFHTDDDNVIDRIFAAEIIGHEGEGPVVLHLGTLYNLEPISPPDGFVPDDDEDLGEGFDDDADDQGDNSDAGAA
jgi:hypothetical protein